MNPIDASPLVKTDPELGGRAGVITQSSAIEWYLFGTYSTANDQMNAYRTVDECRQASNSWHPKERGKDGECYDGGRHTFRRSRLWLITTAARSSQFSLGGEVFVTPADAGAVGPALNGGSRRTICRMLVKVGGEPGAREFEMDFGGRPVEVYGSSVTVVPQAPTGMLPVLPGTALSANQNVSMDILQVCIEPIEQSRGSKDAVVTIYNTVPLNTQSTIEVPPYATRCQIFQSSGGAAETAWTMMAGPTQIVGTIPFGVGTRATEPFDVPGEVTHFLTGPADVATQRLYTMRFRIEP